MERLRKKQGSKAVVWGLVVMAVLFFLLLGRLFALRFEAGDVLPAYSSLRSDPLGARALYDSLDGLPRVTVHRHFQDLKKLDISLKSGANRTILILGSHYFASTFFGKEQMEAYGRLAAGGARMVIACYPIQKRTLSAVRMGDDRDEENGEKEKDASGSQDQKADEDEILNPPRTDPGDSDKKSTSSDDPMAEIRKHSLEKLWGFKMEIAGDDEDMDTVKAGRGAPENWPRKISWHSRLYFDQLDTNWRVLYSVGEMPVMMERPVGRGSAVLVADSYPFSNEALLKERHPAMLAWLVSPESSRDITVIFDEAHLGIQETENIAVLIRKYRLYWPLAVLILLAALYIWKNAVSLVPPPDSDRERRRNVHSSGRDSFSGLISLMRRSVPVSDILKVCYDEWRHTYTLENDKQRLLEQVEAEIEYQPKGDPEQVRLVEKYRTISQILSKGRPWKKARTS